MGFCVTFSDCAINVKTRTKAEAIVHITSPATKSDALTYQAVFAVWQLRIFFLPCFQSLKCLCHSLARRGQPCIMSALTAMQLYRIQSLDRSKQKLWRTVHRVCFWESNIFNTDQIKLWITCPCRSTSIYCSNIPYIVLNLIFEGAHVAPVWSDSLSPALSFMSGLWPVWCCVMCQNVEGSLLTADTWSIPRVYDLRWAGGHTHHCWFGSFISNPGAPLLMWVCWF